MRSIQWAPRIEHRIWASSRSNGVTNAFGERAKKGVRHLFRFPIQESTRLTQSVWNTRPKGNVNVPTGTETVVTKSTFLPDKRAP